MSNFVQVVQKRIGMNKFVRTESHIVSIFQNSFGAIMHLSDCSCAPILQFFDAALDGATANPQNSGPHFWSIF